MQSGRRHYRNKLHIIINNVEFQLIVSLKFRMLTSTASSATRELCWGQIFHNNYLQANKIVQPMAIPKFYAVIVTNI